MDSVGRKFVLRMLCLGPSQNEPRSRVETTRCDELIAQTQCPDGLCNNHTLREDNPEKRGQSPAGRRTAPTGGEQAGNKRCLVVLSHSASPFD